MAVQGRDILDSSVLLLHSFFYINSLLIESNVKYICREHLRSL